MVVVREIPRFDRRREGIVPGLAPAGDGEQGPQLSTAGRRRPAVVGLDPADGFLERLSDPNGDLAREWDRDHDRHVVERLLAVVRPDFTPTTWEAFRRFGSTASRPGGWPRSWGCPRTRSSSPSPESSSV